MQQVLPSAQRANDIVLPRDATERRRVLNILAQRRHRIRKKEKLASAERILATAEQQQFTHNEAAVSDLQPVPGDVAPTPMPFDFDFDIGNLNWPLDPLLPLSGAPCQGGTLSSTPNITDIVQDDAIRTTTFLDDRNLSMPDLDLLRVALENGKRLGQADRLFSLTAESIFQSGDCSTWTSSLPDNLKPTPAQLSIAHPPKLDVLPWPQVRTKLIMLYSQPAEVWPRHPVDGSVLTVIRLVYDMEDGGVRVRGPEPWSDDTWEIEQGFFETGWFALDQSVVRSTNLKQLARGQPRLTGPGTLRV